MIEVWLFFWLGGRRKGHGVDQFIDPVSREKWVSQILIMSMVSRNGLEVWRRKRDLAHYQALSGNYGIQDCVIRSTGLGSSSWKKNMGINTIEYFSCSSIKIILIRVRENHFQTICRESLKFSRVGGSRSILQLQFLIMWSSVPWVLHQSNSIMVDFKRIEAVMLWGVLWSPSEIRILLGNFYFIIQRIILWCVFPSERQYW